MFERKILSEIQKWKESLHIKKRALVIKGLRQIGKTTIVNLLMKFYEINAGDIIIDGHSIRDLTRENIHSLFTMILQDTWLFEGTIKENIVYNRNQCIP